MPIGGNQQAKHGSLKDQILIDLGSRANVMIENTPNGLFRSVHGNRVVRIGHAGMPDIRGAISTSVTHPDSGHWFMTAAVALAVEVKTGRGVLRKDQRKWRDRFISCGGLYILALRVEDVHTVVGPPGSTFNLTQLEEALNAQSTSHS